MSEQRTEKATPRRLQRARAAGDLPYSAIATSAAVWVVALAGAVWLGNRSWHAFANVYSEVVHAAASPSRATLKSVSQLALGAVIDALLPMFAVMLLAAMIVGGLQTRFSFVPNLVSPKFKRMQPKRSIEHAFSRPRLIAILVASVAGLGGLVIVCVTWLEHAPRLTPRAITGAVDPLTHVSELGWSSLVRLALVMASVAAADFFYRQWQYHQDKRLSRRELREEQKAAEGDPLYRRYRRRVAREAIMRTDLEHAVAVVQGNGHTKVVVCYRPDDVPWIAARGDFDVELLTGPSLASVPQVFDPVLCERLRTVAVGGRVPQHLYGDVAKLIQSLGIA